MERAFFSDDRKTYYSPRAVTAFTVDGFPSERPRMLEK